MVQQFISYPNDAQNSYDTARNSYNSAKDNYNTQVAAEKARAADFFKSIFEAPVEIPNRPSQPQAPPTWTGPTVKYFHNTTEQTTFGNLAWEQKKNIATYAGALTNTNGDKPSFGSGYLAATPDNTAPAAAPFNASWAGHSFGLIGQGDLSMPEAGNAWAGIPDAARDAASYHMAVSIFPYDGTDTTGLAANTNVTIAWSSVAWRNFGSLTGPTAAPQATVAPDAAGAKALAAGALAIAAVAATMA